MTPCYRSLLLLIALSVNLDHVTGNNCLHADTGGVKCPDWAQCCSSSFWCGSGDAYCGAGCQSEYSWDPASSCNNPTPTPPSPPTPPPTPPPAPPTPNPNNLFCG
eukprot:CAMPEP_0183713804 /NCGR_PEP_ID=MMETSP0737-20130205/8550_1 /TAXON_ID=385413 /ORGANISM="Thalassiosira miniscula, Strain CCMP1093" /LENGTH=104 /DNA_ID=CAMNT_0025942647 /DNA_START=79 /DNA_END=390 /DNA_ORIENTATION=+